MNLPDMIKMINKDTPSTRDLFSASGDTIAPVYTIPHLGTHLTIIEATDAIIAHAIEGRASDIHIEPSREGATVRLRVDGALHTFLELPREIYLAVMGRLKILASLKTDEARRPQNGRIELDRYAASSLRISTIPTLHGEKAVLRILESNEPRDFSLDRLGFSSAHQELIMRNIQKPFGMIVSSGPTGSGKTTTLYGLINLLPKGDINVSTLEDPIEYSLTGVTQMQVNPAIGLTFANGLRALLRQDPDVMMVGEIRDAETAVIAANAALTGHLVFTTLHTNDAPSAFVRLLEMRIDDFVTASIVNLVIAQRLVRRVCPHCTVTRTPDPAIIKKMNEYRDLLKALVILGKDTEELARTELKGGAGCRRCMNTGYLGRIGIFEIVELNKQVHDLILAHASAEVMKAACEETGFRDMASDGMAKVLAGITTLEELLRVTKSAGTPVAGIGSEVLYREDLGVME